MKKFKFLVVLLLVATLVVGCSNGGKEDGKIVIGYSTPSQNDTGQTIAVGGAQEYAKANNIELNVQDAKEDDATQQDQIKAFITQGVDALVVVPVNTSSMGPIIEAAKEAGIPLVFVNRNPFGTAEPAEGTYYVGSEEFVAGEMQAKALIELMGETGGVGILQGKLDNEGAVKRTEGNEDVLSKYPGVKVLNKETGNWQRDQGMNITQNWITAYGTELKAILANNDEMALGAIQALAAAGRTDVIVMGVDAIDDARAAVKAGTMAVTVKQDLAAQGRTGIEVAHKVIKGESVDVISWIPFVPLNKDNIDKN